MVKVNRINTSQIEGGYSDDTDKRPSGEIALYNDDNGGFDLVIHDGVNSTNLNKVLGKGKLYGHGADSADGNGYDTIKLIPDIPAHNGGSDQYIIIDPTGPNHVHIRAGGTIDNSNAELIVGGENSNVKIGAGANPEITIESNNNSWTFDTDGTLIVPGVVQNTGSFEIKAGTATNSVEFLGQIDNGFGDGPGATLHVTSIINGTITDGMTIYGEGLPAEGWVLQFGTVMAPQGNGGTGNYYLSGANYLIGSQSFNNGDAASNIWTFAPSGDLIFPSQLSISPLSNFVPASGTVIQQASGQILDILSVGSGGFMAAGWVENSSSPGSVTSISFNEVPGDVRIKTGSFAEVVRQWVYDSAGDLTIPGNINLSNSSKIATGTFDNGTSGNSGISLVCGVGYELNWQGGHLKNTADNGISSSNILCDSSIEFPGSGFDNMEINSSGLIFSDGTIQTSAALVTDIVSGTGISVSSVSGIYTINSTGSGLYVDQAASLVTTVFNETGSPIPKMTAVYIDGGHGDKPTVDLAIATGDPTSAGTYGLTLENIDNMQIGKVIVFGALFEVNTDPANGGIPGATEGSVLYLSPTIPGGITTTKPSAPNHIVTIGTVVRVHQNQGVIEVRIVNGFELEELHNVSISGVSHNNILVYNSGTSLWQNNSNAVFSNPSGITGASGINNVVQISQANYDALVIKDPNTLYFIV